MGLFPASEPDIERAVGAITVRSEGRIFWREAGLSSQLAGSSEQMGAAIYYGPSDSELWLLPCVCSQISCRRNKQLQTSSAEVLRENGQPNWFAPS